jgi:hypothetical protein
LCAFHGTNSDHAIAVDPLKKISAVLSPGGYRVDINVACGDKLFSKWRDMTVGEKPFHTYWTGQLKPLLVRTYFPLPNFVETIACCDD